MTSSVTIAANRGLAPGVAARANGEAEGGRGLGRLHVQVVPTSMWSQTNPTGTTTHGLGAPTLASSPRWSLTSGSSQGTLGGPLRLW